MYILSVYVNVCVLMYIHVYIIYLLYLSMYLCIYMYIYLYIYISIQEMVFVLTRMGNSRQALALLLEHVGDVSQAIEFCQVCMFDTHTHSIHIYI